jgi:ubiquinone/menaquinone biosynthesis C-methylase UbiE
MTEPKDFYESNVWRFHDVANPYERFRLKNLLEFLAPKPTEIVLDVGSGGGSYTKSVAKRSTVVASDLSRGAIKSAKENMTEVETIFFIVSDVEHLPIKEKSIDDVFCIDVIEHLAHVDTALSEMARVLKPSGKISIFTACGNNKLSLEYALRPLFGRLIELIYLKIGHLQAFSTAGLLQLLGNNFVETNIQYMYPWIGSWMNFIWGVANLKSFGTVPSPTKPRDSISAAVLRAIWILLDKENELFKNKSIGGEIVINATKR